LDLQVYQLAALAEIWSIVAPSVLGPGNGERRLGDVVKVLPPADVERIGDVAVRGDFATRVDDGDDAPA
jgi:hypothetical protein